MHHFHGSALLALQLIATAVALPGCGGSDDDASPPSPAPSLSESCPSLAGKSLGNGAASVTKAAVVTATGAQPEYCVVQAKLADSALRFELRLPTSDWNTKLAFLGGGGFDGTLTDATQPYHSESILTERYATITTNGGHDAPTAPPDYFKAEFANDPVQLADFTHESEHRALPLGKELIRLFYGSSATRAYFEGCSMGGHDAMMQSQRYPQDFDGIVARAPAGNVMGLFMQFNRIAKRVRDPAGTLDTTKQTLLADAVLAQCDELDGMADGIISKPAACSFDPMALRCAGGTDAGDACLSDAQLATVNAVTTPIVTADGAWSHAGYYFGGEDDAKSWGEYIWPSSALGDSLQGLFSDGFVRSFITNDASFDTATWDADAWLPQMGQIGAMFSATDPDLSGMLARGAKMVLWNGTTDSSVSPRESAAYYERVVAEMGQADTDKGVELFLAPGVGHCAGGVGPDQIDLLKAVATWVEQGTAPSAQNLVHRKVDEAGTTTMSRPACKYPAYPRYKGVGDVNDATSFSCSTQ